MERAVSAMREVQAETGPRRKGRAADCRAGFALMGALLAAALLLASAGAARAAMYKWVDEKGVVHYTDKMPPEAVDKASVELNKQGIPVRKTEKALTPEQREALDQGAERKRQAARAQEEIDRRDRALVSSYTSEAEIDLARDRALQTINNVILSARAFSEQLNTRKVDVEAKKAESEGKPVVAVLNRELESIDAELARQADVIAKRKREATTITAKYAADKQRWRELVAAKGPSTTASSADAGGAAVVPATGGAKKK
jgi:hypothetical protein